MKEYLKSVKFLIKRYLTRNSPIILCYHGVCSEKLDFPFFTHINKNLFEEHIAFLVKYFNCISLNALMKQIRSKSCFTKNAVVVTFDDGFANNFTEALPILKKYRVPATVFITVGLVDSPRFIWADLVPAMLSCTMMPTLLFDGTVFPITTAKEKQLVRLKILSYLKTEKSEIIEEQLTSLLQQLKVNREELFNNPTLRHCHGILSSDQIRGLHNSGLVEIGSHGMTHTIFSKLSSDEATKEIRKSKALVEEIIGEQITSFAYPNGTVKDFLPEHKQALRDSGYTAVLTTIQGRVHKKADPLQLPRFCISGEERVSGLKYLVSSQWTDKS